MSAISPCVPCCPTPQIVNVPGSQGAAPVDGLNGVNAFTFTSSDINLPAIGSTVVVPVVDSEWMVIGQNVVMEGPANFVVTALPTLLSATLRFLGYPGDLPAGSPILSGAKVGPAGIRGGGTLYYTSTATSLALTDYMDFVEVTADNKTMTLPTAVGREGKMYEIKQTATYTSGTVIATSGGETIDGAASKTIAVTNGYIVVVSNGANWLMLANKLT